MATLFFAKDGKRPNGDRLTRSIDVGIADAVRVFGARGFRFTETPPTINPATCSTAKPR